MARTRAFKLSLVFLAVLVVFIAIGCAQANAEGMSSGEEQDHNQGRRLRKLQEVTAEEDEEESDVNKFFNTLFQDIQDLIDNDPLLFAGIVAASVAGGCLICFCCC